MRLTLVLRSTTAYWPRMRFWPRVIVTLPSRVTIPLIASYTPKLPRPISVGVETTTWPCASIRLIRELSASAAAELEGFAAAAVDRVASVAAAGFAVVAAAAGFAAL